MPGVAVIDHDIALKALAAVCWRAHMLSTLSMSPPAVEYLNRTTNPRPGDLVLEVSNWAANPIDRIGRLLSAKMEPPPVSHVDPATYDESEWERPYPPYLEMTYRIMTLDGREFSWTNARFIAIPEVAFTEDIHEWCTGLKENEDERSSGRSETPVP